MARRAHAYVPAVLGLGRYEARATLRHAVSRRPGPVSVSPEPFPATGAPIRPSVIAHYCTTRKSNSVRCLIGLRVAGVRKSARAMQDFMVTT